MVAVGLLTAALAVSVPPGYEPVNHNQPCHGGYPVVRRFERKPEDDFRRCNWEAFVRQLDLAWEAYRRSNSTPEAFCEYNRQLNDLRREYVFRDPYLVAVPPVEPPELLIEPELHEPRLAPPVPHRVPWADEVPLRGHPEALGVSYRRAW